MIFRLAMYLLPLVLGGLMVLGLNRAEHFFLPVVKDFVVTERVLETRGVVMSGFLRKVRDCEFIGTLATADPGGKMGLQYLDSTYNTTRGLGRQGWGPWRIYIPLIPSAKSVEIRAVHSCHPFWSTQTDLVTIPLDGRPR